MRQTRKATFSLLLLLVAACSTGIVVHDENRAAELIVDFLSGLKSVAGMQLSYAWTDDSFKQTVSPGEFSRMVAAIRNKNQGAEIRLLGYEVFGPVETMNVYASSQVRGGEMYFRFSLVGTKSKDYYLLNLDTKDSEFAKKGIYRDYEESIRVQGV
jgi:hypothetical protein